MSTPEQKRNWYLENRERILERSKEYYLENKDDISRKGYEYRLRNKEELKQRDREFRRRNKEKIKQQKRKTEERLKAIIQDAKKGQPCVECGIVTEDIRKLVFHHINPEEKELSISQIPSRHWAEERLIKEMEKCVLLCMSCHRVVHARIDRHEKEK